MIKAIKPITLVKGGDYENKEVAGQDIVDELILDHALVYDIDNLDHIANLNVGSTPLAISYDALKKHIYISNNDIHDLGVIEYDIETLLQTNKYQVAGILGSHALVVDPQGVYIYAAVDDLSDQDTDEPYNGSSFNIQKITIIP